MSKTYGKVEIEETDNGWIVKTSYFCHGGEKLEVFTKWRDVVELVSEAMGKDNPNKIKKPTTTLTYKEK